MLRQVEETSNEVQLLQRLDEHNGAVNGVAVYGNRLVASGSGDKLVRVWSACFDDENLTTITGFQEMSYSPLDAHKYSVNHVEFSPCGTMLASCSMDGNTTIWNTDVI